MIKKAGIIPYYKDKILVCRSSDPLFGGPLFAISKGNIDIGESVIEAAIREGEEELGLKRTNMIDKTLSLVSVEMQVTKSSTYELTIYRVEVIDPYDFNKPDWEIAETKWMTIDEFMRIGRESHKIFVSKLA